MRKELLGMEGNMQLETFVTPKEIGNTLSQDIIAGIIYSQNPHYLLGLPTGATPMPIITSLVEQALSLSDTQKHLIAQRLHIIVMDDFIELDRDANIASTDPNSGVFL